MKSNYFLAQHNCKCTSTLVPPSFGTFSLSFLHHLQYYLDAQTLCAYEVLLLKKRSCWSASWIRWHLSNSKRPTTKKKPRIPREETQTPASQGFFLPWPSILYGKSVRESSRKYYCNPCLAEIRKQYKSNKNQSKAFGGALL